MMCIVVLTSTVFRCVKCKLYRKVTQTRLFKTQLILACPIFLSRYLVLISICVEPISEIESIVSRQLTNRFDYTHFTLAIWLLTKRKLTANIFRFGNLYLSKYVATERRSDVL